MISRLLDKVAKFFEFQLMFGYHCGYCQQRYKIMLDSNAPIANNTGKDNINYAFIYPHYEEMRDGAWIKVEEKSMLMENKPENKDGGMTLSLESQNAE